MAGRTFTLSLCRGMTRHARPHIVHHLLAHHIALADRSMAGLACRACLSVHTVAEVDKCRDPIDADPWNRLLFLRSGRYLLNVRTVGLYRLVATHAETLRWEPHKLSGISVSVTGIAFQAQGQVGFVTIGRAPC